MKRLPANPKGSGSEIEFLSNLRFACRLVWSCGGKSQLACNTVKVIASREAGKRASTAAHLPLILTLHGPAGLLLGGLLRLRSPVATSLMLLARLRLLLCLHRHPSRV